MFWLTYITVNIKTVLL